MKKEIRIYPIGAQGYYHTNQLHSPDGKEITAEQLLSPDYGWEFVCIETGKTKQYLRVSAIESIVIDPMV